MSKRGISIFILVLITLTGCSKLDNKIISEQPKENTIVTEQKVNETEVHNETDLLNEYLELLEEIVDYSIFYKINQFAGKVINWASSNNDVFKAEAISYYEEVSDIFKKIVEKEALAGFGFERDWESLRIECNNTLRTLDLIVRAVEDNDAGGAISYQSIYDNSETLKIALVIKNKIDKEINLLKLYDIEPIISKKSAIEKASRYANYLYKKDSIKLELNNDYQIINTIGKYYNFIVTEDNKTSILINVETSGIVLYRNNSYEFVPDSILPAFEGEVSMPDVIGMKEDEAVNLLAIKGLECQISYMAGDFEEEGLVKWSSPESGKVIFEDTEILLTVILKSSEEQSNNLTREEALKILESNLVLYEGEKFGDGRILEVDGREYYIFTVENEFSIMSAYCIDVITGDLYDTDEEFTLTPYNN